jgi:hypothetical protein
VEAARVVSYKSAEYRKTAKRRSTSGDGKAVESVRDILGKVTGKRGA